MSTVMPNLLPPAQSAAVERAHRPSAVQPEQRLAARAASLDWTGIEAGLDAVGCATTGPLLTPGECTALAALYDQDTPFRSRVVMAQHGFGRGEYKYYAYPLPDPIQALRAPLYERLVPVANC